MKLYLTTNGNALDFTAYAAKDAKAAWKAGRLVQEVGEVKGGDGKIYIVRLVEKSKVTEQQQLF